MKLKEILENKIKINEELNEITMTDTLSRDDYLELKKYLEIIGGNYATSGKKFIFNTNPKPLVESFIATEIMPLKNPTAFFPTPIKIVEEMVRISDFDCLPSDEEYQNKYRILEPSGGVGGIADVIKKYAPFSKLDVIEILDVNQEVLRQKGYNPICMDFMDYNSDFSINYDYILMNPPYQGRTYIKHIKHAYNMLNERGILVAVIPTSFISNGDKLSKWLFNKIAELGEIYHNEENSFIEQGTKVDTCIIYINKEVQSWRLQEYQGCKNYWTWQVWLSLYTSGDFYNSLEKLKEDKHTKDKLKAMILRELDAYRSNYCYFSYRYIDDYVEKIYEYYCYIKEELKNYYKEEVIETITEKKVSVAPIYEQAQIEAFKKGLLF